MQRFWFIQGVEQLLQLASHQTTAILCSEEDPARCHRHHLIARYLMLTHPDVTILHIRKDARILEAQSVEHLPDEHGADQPSFLEP